MKFGLCFSISCTFSKPLLSSLSCSFLSVTKTVIFASIMEDKLKDNKSYMECFLIFFKVNVHFFKKKRRLDLLHKHSVNHACSLTYHFLQLKCIVVNHNASDILNT